MIKRILFTVLTLAWMILIFSFSAQPADASTEISHSAGQKIGEWFVPGFSSWQPERQESFAAAIDYPVRKGAHASEYAVLTLLIAGMLYSFGNRVLKVSFVLAVVYAASDEFHQLFVPGRSGQLKDVLIDAAGALAACLLLALCRGIRRRFHS